MTNANIFVSLTRKRTRLERYSLALALTLLAFGLRWLLIPQLGFQLPYAFFFFATLLVSAWCGWRAGIGSVLLGLYLGKTFFVAQAMKGPQPPLPWWVSGGVYVLNGVVVVVLSEGQRLLRLKTEDALKQATIRAEALRAETERREVLTAQKEAERAQFEAVLRQMPGGVVIEDARSGEMLLANAQVAALVPEGDPARGKHPAEQEVGFLQPDGTPLTRADWPLQRAIRRGEITVAQDCVYVASDGERRVLRTNAAPIRDGGGQIVAGVATFYDATRQVETEMALRESERKANLMTEVMPQLVWSARPDGYNDWFNQRWYDYMALDYEQSKGSGWSARLHPDDVPETLRRWQHALATGDLYEMEYRIQGPDGEYRWFLGRALPIRDDDGRILRWFGTCTDVDAQRRAEEARRQALTEVERLNVNLRRAMQETHHRVKNNLQVIAALVDIQAESGMPVVPTSELRRINQHIRSLASLHDLLTRQARDTGGTGGEEGVSARDVMLRLHQLIQGTVGARRVFFEVDLFRLSVRQSASLSLLVNELVSNAIKHSGGDVRVALHCRGERAHLCVDDDGDGFAPDFDPRTAANTGLELIEISSRHDLRGDITYTNRPEGGAQVIVTFPLAASDALQD